MKTRKNYKILLVIIVIGILATIGNSIYIYMELSKNQLPNMIISEENKINDYQKQINGLRSYQTKDIGEIKERFEKLNRSMIFMYGKFSKSTIFEIASPNIKKDSLKTTVTKNKYIKKINMTITLADSSSFLSELKSLIYFKDMIKNKPFKILSIKRIMNKTIIELELYGKDNFKSKSKNNNKKTK